jgi:hypothetical protein
LVAITSIVNRNLTEAVGALVLERIHVWVS